ncbi:MAG: glutamyl-tRNA reductase [Spirochaetia bacterium]|nr:glutamyl-tRNA reductase [Spirochaetia bacterium]
MICVVGINHTTAPVAIREKFSSSDEEIVSLLKDLLSLSTIDEAVFLSTCNRSELYLVAGPENADEFRRDILEQLRNWKNAEEEEMDCFYHYRNSHAVRHVLGVAAGLDSMVLGENQVLGQLKQAYRLSATRGMTGRILDRLFHKAFESGKRVRTETQLNKGSSSVSSTAVELAVESLESLHDKSALLVGTGEAGTLVLQSLSDRGCGELYVTGRNPERSAEAAAQYGAKFREYGAVMESLHEYDLVLVSTAATQPVIRSEHILRLSSRLQSPLLIMDLSVPRNVEVPPECPALVHLYNVDDLQALTERTKARRSAEVEKAQLILNSQRDEFLAWLSSLQLSPTIHKLKQKTQSLYEEQLASLKKKIPAEEYQRLEEFTSYLEGRWLGLIIRNLRKLTEGGRNLGYIEMLHTLFQLEEQEKNKDELDGGG